MDIPSGTYQRRFVRYEISGLHATGGQPFAGVAQYPVHGTYGVSLFEKS